jgi:hypothetical protein
MKTIHIKRTEDYDWQQLWVDGELIEENHSISAHAWINAILMLGAKVIEYELLVDEQHEDLTGEEKILRESVNGKVT